MSVRESVCVFVFAISIFCTNRPHKKHVRFSLSFFFFLSFSFTQIYFAYNRKHTLSVAVLFCRVYVIATSFCFLGEKQN